MRVRATQEGSSSFEGHWIDIQCFGYERSKEDAKNSCGTKLEKNTVASLRYSLLASSFQCDDAHGVKLALRGLSAGIAEIGLHLWNPLEKT